jgi:hypothetical protein
LLPPRAVLLVVRSRRQREAQTQNREREENVWVGDLSAISRLFTLTAAPLVISDPFPSLASTRYGRRRPHYWWHHLSLLWVYLNINIHSLFPPPKQYRCRFCASLSTSLTRMPTSKGPTTGVRVVSEFWVERDQSECQQTCHRSCNDN